MQPQSTPWYYPLLQCSAPSSYRASNVVSLIIMVLWAVLEHAIGYWDGNGRFPSGMKESFSIDGVLRVSYDNP